MLILLAKLFNFVLIKAYLSHPLMCLDFHDYLRNDNHGETVKINENVNAADDGLQPTKNSQSTPSLRRNQQFIVLAIRE